MNTATKRSILRWVHLIATIPMLGYVYGKPSEVEQYVGGVRYIFAPLLILSGYWMYGGWLFAIIGAALWVGVFQMTGSAGAAILSQVVVLIARKIWLAITRARHSTDRTVSNHSNHVESSAP